MTGPKRALLAVLAENKPTCDSLGLSMLDLQKKIQDYDTIFRTMSLALSELEEVKRWLMQRKYQVSGLNRRFIENNLPMHSIANLRLKEKEAMKLLQLREQDVLFLR